MPEPICNQVETNACSESPVPDTTSTGKIHEDLAVKAPVDENDDQGLPPDSGDDDNDGFGRWFRDNNPLYLLSVLFMLLGLHLVSSDAQASNLGVNGLLAFFAVQNVYEIVMVVMALYLLKNQIQAGHGKILLLFVLLFLGDVTFYQVRISGLSAFYGNMATLIYMILGLIKFAAVIKVLNLTIYHWRILYVGGAFTLIWVGPKLAYNIVDSVGRAASGYFDATSIIYFVWCAAGLIHLPLIIENWRKSSLSDDKEHLLVGNETTFWRYLMIFPMVMMPIQLILNVMADSSLSLAKSTPAITLVLPWLIMAGFFVQAMWRKAIEESVGINNFDGGLLAFSLIVVMATTQAEVVPVTLNFVLVVTGMIITLITRGNLFSGVGLSIIIVYFAGRQLLEVGKQAVDYGSGMSRTAWAAILMVGSFFMLGLGFLISIRKKH
jgi:hypothetical protein